MASTNDPSKTSATHFQSLHQPGNPLILMNVYDPPSARAVASLPTCKALATASYAIAESAGLKDADLTREVNLRGARLIAAVAREFGLPLTVDVQGGYGDELEGVVREIIKIGAVGCNLEDVDERTGELYDVDVAVERIGRVVRIARECGVEGFVVNARTDVILFGGGVDDAIERGKRYLNAGAKIVFPWGGRKRGGLTRDEAKRLTEGLGGWVNLSMKIEEGKGNLTVDEFRKMGVARISVGPQLQMFAMDALKKKAEGLLDMGK